MNTKRFYAFCSKSNFTWILALVFAICQLQFGVSSVSASTRLWFHSVDTNTPVLLPAVCPPSISFGETIQCSIVSAGETDAYTFTASAGDKVLIRMSKSSGTLQPGIKIYSGAIELCQASGSATAEIASCTLPSTGTYTILAYDGFNGTSTGDYYLSLQRLNNPGNAVSIVFGQTLSGSISTPAAMETYTFTANAGDKVLVRMSKSSGTLYPGIRVYSPDGTKLCEEDGLYTAEIASCPLTSTGTYSIIAYDGFGHVAGGTSTGDYRLCLNCGNVYLPLILK